MRPTGSHILRGILLATSCLVVSPLVLATGAVAGGPSGGTVVVGKATVTNPSSTSTVVNQTTNKALIDWNSFSISAGSSVTFDQPGAKSITVNRVTGNGASSIYGDLFANGRIWLINGNGILFGHGSQINVGALIATTSDITDQDFRKGQYRFSVASPNTNASVVNQGTIRTATHGSVVLSAPRVSNEGIIQADLGTVVLGGANAFTVDTKGDNLIRYQITAPVTKTPENADGSPSAALVSNSGTIMAAGGKVLMTARAARNVEDNVINNSGIVEATSVSSHNGEIDLDAGPNGSVTDSGTLDASGKANGQTGGTVTMTGSTVDVADGAHIDASGDAGGGTVKIGGDFHGKGTLYDATTTHIGNATITADAITKGNGGRVAVWANTNTTFAGTISAKGGAKGGDGGYVETSGGNLQVGTSAKVNTSAALGLTGDWLIDPTDIDIIAGGTDGIGGSNIDPNTIIGALASTNVTLEATHDITVDSAVEYSSTNTLSLLASQDIIANASIQNSGNGAINLIAGWDGATTNLSALTNPGVFGNNEGSITIGGANASGDVAVGSASGLTTIAGNQVTVEADNGYAQIGYHGTGGGDINVFTNNDLTFVTGEDPARFAQLGNGDATGNNFAGSGSDTDIGNATGTITLQAGGDIFFNEANEPLESAWIGNVGGSGHSESGNVTLIAAGENDNCEDNCPDTIGTMLKADVGTSASTGGDFTVAFSEEEGSEKIKGLGPLDTPHAVTVALAGSIEITGTVQNQGTGAITLIAGWDSDVVTPDDIVSAVNTSGGASLAHLFATSPGSYGANEGSVLIGGENAPGNVSFGSAGGTTTVLADEVVLEADNGYAQIGYHGTGGGDIDILATGDIALITGEGVNQFAQIGNGDASGNNFDGTGGDDGIGNATGNISIRAGGDVLIDEPDEELPNAWIGNVAGTGHTESGNFTLIAADVTDACEEDCGDLLGPMIGADLGTTAHPGSGGDVTLALTAPEEGGSFGGATFDSPNALTFATAGSIEIVGSTQNQGTGAMTLIAGWDPNVVTPDDIVNAANTTGGASIANLFLTTPGSYGVGEGSSVMIGGEDAGGDVAFGSAGGTTTVLGGSVTLEADNGYAQIGFNGDASGDIRVDATGGISLDANSNFAQIGHGGANSDGNNSGDIDVEAQGSIDLLADNGYAQIGHGGAGSNDDEETAGTNSGDITVVGSSVSLVGGNAYGAYAQIGHGGLSSSNVSLADPADSGDISVTATTGDIDLQGGDALNAYTLIGQGGAYSGATGNSFAGDIAVAAEEGSIFLVGSTTSDAQSGFAQIGDNGTANMSGDIAVNAANDISLVGGNSGSEGIGFAFAQIGDAGGGTLDANIDVFAGGDLALTGGTGTGGSAIDSAQIGNGGVGGLVFGNPGDPVSGDISVNVVGTTTLSSSTAGDDAWIGNIPPMGASNTGSVSLITGDLDLSEDALGDFPHMVGLDLGAGNVTIGITDSDSDTEISGTIAYSNPHTFTLLSAGSLDITGNIQSSGTGDVIVMAGWDTEVAPTDVFIVPGAYGNNGGSVTIGGDDAAGDVSVGSAGGLTTVAGADVTVDSTNGTAQIGYAGAGTGDIDVFAIADVSVADNSGNVALIGNGSLGTNTAVSGDITVQAGSGVSIDGNSEGGVAGIGNLGAADASESGALTVTAGGALDLDAQADSTDVFIGNLSIGAGGAADGDIDVTAGSTTVESHGASARAQIGNGRNNTSMSGDLTLMSGDVDLVSDGAGGFARIGAKSGADSSSATGDITVISTGHVVLTSGDEGNTIIGDGINAGDVSGDILVTAAGEIQLNANGDSSQARIGNASSTSVSSDLTVTADGEILLDAGGNAAGAFISNLGGDVSDSDVSVTSTHGDITLEAEGDGGASVIVGNADNGTPGDLSGTVTVTADDSENGVVTLAADGNNAFVLIGNGASGGSGSASGDVTVNAGNAVEISADGSSSGVQIGDGGANYTGNTSGNVSVLIPDGELDIANDADGTAGFVQIGNGGVGSSGDASGNILVDADSGISLAIDATTSDINIGNGGIVSNGSATGTIEVDTSGALQMTIAGGNNGIQIGNGGVDSNENAATGFSEAGDITINAGTITMTTAGQENAIQIGNGGSCAGASSAAANADCGTTGSVTTSGSVAFGGNITVNAGSLDMEANNLVDGVWIGNGGDHSGEGLTVTGGSIADFGNIDVTLASGSLTMLTGAPGDSDVRIGNGGFNADIATASGGISIGGDVTVSVAGDATLNASSATAGDSVQIGNSGGQVTNGTVGGDVDVTVGGDLTMGHVTGVGYSVIGDFTGEAAADTGSVTIEANKLDGVDASIANDLPHGDLTMEITGTDAVVIDTDVDYQSPHTLTLLAAGDIDVEASVENSLASGGGDMVMVAGWDGHTTDPDSLTNPGVFGNNNGSITVGGADAEGNAVLGDASGTLTVAADNITLEADNGFAQIGFDGAHGGDINVTASGDLTVTGGDGEGDFAQLGNGNLGSGTDGNVTGDITATVAGDTTFENDGWIGNFAGDGGNETGNVTLITGNGFIFADNITADLGSGDGSGGNVFLGFTGTEDTFLGDVDYNSANSLTFAAAGNVNVIGDVQNAGTGAVVLDAGWDGHTVGSASALQTANAYGLNDAVLTVGGSEADGDVAVGSAGGTTTLLTDTLNVDAVNGYALVGFHGASTGNIAVFAAGDVTLTGGGDTGLFAQIGSGGYQTTGNHSGAITVTAGGDIALNGGDGQEAYAQIGTGGAESNTDSEGYTDNVIVTVSGQTVTLDAGTGNASYVQIGNGGYKSGAGLTGTATIGGAITVDSAESVSLNGNGADAYAQIGNGGDQVNTNAGSGAGGTVSGDIIVAVADMPGGSVTTHAGTGAASYVQIGNGGYSIDAPTTAVAASFTISGNVSVSDLTLIGSDTGADGYAQVGDGDASLTSVGNVNGNVTINSPNHVTVTSGTAPGASAGIGGATGQGTVTGTVTGFAQSSDADQQQQQTSTQATLTAQTTSPGSDQTNIVAVTGTPTTPEDETSSAGTGGDTVASQPTPLEQMADSSDNGDTGYEGTKDSDKVADSIAQSFGSGPHGKTTHVTHTIIPGVLTQIVTVNANKPHGVPSADQDYSSWGNETLWQW